MNLKFTLIPKTGRTVINVELGEHDDYVYRWYNAAVNLGLIYEMDNLIHPAICRAVEVRDGEVYLKSRWCHEFCMNAGLHKRKYIELQFTTWELQEQIEAGNTEIEYWLYDKAKPHQVYQAWRELPKRDSKTTREMIKIGKSLHKPTKHGCEPEYQRFTSGGFSKLCCMCNENEKLLLM